MPVIGNLSPKFRKTPAQSALEFALALPVVLMLLFGIIEFGRYFYSYISVFSASREAARYGSASGANSSGTLYYRDCAGIAAAAVRVGSFAGVSTSTVDIRYDTGPADTTAWASLPTCSSSPTLNFSNSLPRIRVKVTGSFSSVAPFTRLQNMTLTSTSTRTVVGKADIQSQVINPSAPSGTKPTLTSISPNTTPAGSAQFVLTAYGTDFVSGSAIQWNGTNLVTTYVNSVTLTAIVPASLVALPGTASVTIWSPSGVSGAATFTITSSPPTLTSISPTSATAGSASITLTLTGTNFVASSVAVWNTIDLSTTYVSATQLTAVVPASLLASGGTFPVVVSNPGSGTSSSKTFTVNNPVPTLTGISPASAIAGDPDVTLTVTGSSFTPTSSVLWGGTALATTFISSTQLTAIIPAASIASPGTFSISVSNPTPGGGTSGTLSFSVLNPVPVITEISPDYAMLGSSAFTLTVTGSKFVSGAVVYWGSTALTTTFGSSTSLTAAVPASGLTTKGTINVTVVNPTPGGGTSNALAFTISAVVLNSISPTAVTAMGADFTLTANGAGFVSGSVIRWNGTALTTTYVSATQLTAVVPAANIASAGTATITVRLPSADVSNSKKLTINNPVPTLTGISPTSTMAGSAAFTLTVTGTLFTSSATVLWNGASQTTTYISATQLSIAVPASAVATAGTVNVTVNNPTPGGGTSSAQVFTINNPVPTITGLSPNNIMAGSAAFTMTVTGTNFVPNSSVLWGGSALTTTYVSSTVLTAQVLATHVANEGTVNVTVYNPAPGGGTSAASVFTVTSNCSNLPPPTTTQSSKKYIVALSNIGTTAVTITGTTIEWSGAKLSSITIDNPSATLMSSSYSSPSYTLSMSQSLPGNSTTRNLTFQFANSTYTISRVTVTFSNGCSVTAP